MAISLRFEYRAQIETKGPIMKQARRVHATLLIAALMLTFCSGASAQQDTTAAAPAPPANLAASDHPMDGGNKIDLKWELSPDDPTGKAEGEGMANFAGYRIYRSQTESEIKTSSAEAIASARKDAMTKVTRAKLEQFGFDPDDFDRDKLTEERRRELRQARAQAAKTAEAEVTTKNDAKAGVTQYTFVTNSKPGENSFTVLELEREGYTFGVEAYTLSGQASTQVRTTAAVTPALQWFDGGRFWLAMIAVTLCGAIIVWILLARNGRPIKVRKIAGLEAVDEAVGRATEMGRSCLFVPGIQDMNDIQTIAGITVLSRVAKTAAEYDAKVEVPTSRSLVMTTARETVQAAFLTAGRPDAYNEDFIYYVTDEQFGYVAYLQGMMVREKPAACFYMGSFFAESLILAETGNSIGAIQVAGTAQPAQLPFFVAACDYTLIGEEFFAASAYLSGSPEELGSLKGQDVGKLIVWIFMVIGITLFTLAAITKSELMMTMVNYIRDTMLT